jgi:hypothetical protein
MLLILMTAQGVQRWYVRLTLNSWFEGLIFGLCRKTASAFGKEPDTDELNGWHGRFGSMGSPCCR